MRNRRSLLMGSCCAFFLFLPLQAAAIDGSWIIDRETPRGTMKLLLNLKAEGGKLTGTIGRVGGDWESRIEEGRISGVEISFTTVQRGKKAEMKVTWTGELSGDEIKGEMKMDMFPEGRPFTAKRSSPPSLGAKQ